MRQSTQKALTVGRRFDTYPDRKLTNETKAQIAARLAQETAEYLKAGGFVESLPGFTEIKPRPICRYATTPESDPHDWKQMPGAEGYLISRDARVWSRYKKAVITKMGYSKQIHICVKGSRRRIDPEEMARIAFGGGE